MKKALEAVAERGLSIAAFIFPFIEVTSYFGPKVFLMNRKFGSSEVFT